ncbi:MAG: hypothetical protein AAFV53_15805, partial [Myxococcota bacterium]
RAAPWLRDALDAGCILSGHQRAFQVRSLVNLATIQLDTGNTDDAGALITRARALWPDPNPAHPTAIRLTALEARIAPAAAKEQP